jgi:hypothetical protein
MARKARYQKMEEEQVEIGHGRTRRQGDGRPINRQYRNRGATRTAKSVRDKEDNYLRKQYQFGLQSKG